MAKKKTASTKEKYYAIRTGKKTGYTKSRELFHKYTDSFVNKSYKVCSNLEEVKEFLGAGKVNSLDRPSQPPAKEPAAKLTAQKQPAKPVSEEKTNPEPETVPVSVEKFTESLPDMDLRMKSKTMTAYIDGSYNPKNDRYGFGVVYFLNSEKYEANGSNKDGDSVLTSVAGELKAALTAISIALQSDVKTLDIYYDFDGIEYWATHYHTRRIPLVDYYYTICSDALDNLEINFYKLKAHTGNITHNQAQKLAREACAVR